MEYIFLTLKLLFVFGILYMAYHVLPKNGNDITFTDDSPKWDDISEINIKPNVKKFLKKQNNISKVTKATKI